MRDRRSRIAPPEMMNGSTRGSASSNSSALVTSMRQIEEVQLTSSPVHGALLLEAPQLGDESILRVEHQLVQCPLSARSGPRRELVQRQLKEGVHLHRFAPCLGVGDHVAPGADAARAAETGERRLLHLT